MKPARNVMRYCLRVSKEKGGVVSMITLLVKISIVISMAVISLLQGKHVLQLNSMICEPHEADLDPL